jgi:hypothetical protein
LTFSRPLEWQVVGSSRMRKGLQEKCSHSVKPFMDTF